MVVGYGKIFFNMYQSVFPIYLKKESEGVGYILAHSVSLNKSLIVETNVMLCSKHLFTKIKSQNRRLFILTICAIV